MTATLRGAAQDEQPNQTEPGDPTGGLEHPDPDGGGEGEGAVHATTQLVVVFGGRPCCAG